MHKHFRPSTGFTIVELLIVIVVIAILAAISTVAYRGLQERARAADVSSALSQAKRKLELYKVDHGAYPTSGNLASAGVTSNEGSFQYTSDGSAFCLTATSGSISYTATNTTNPTPGGCAGHGQGGAAAVTNLATNPRGMNISGINSNSGSLYPITKNVTVPTTLDGLTTAVESRCESGCGGGNSVLTVYNVDGLMNTSGITRSISVWVRVNASGYRAFFFDQPRQEIPANTWIRLQTTTPIAGTEHATVYIARISGAPNASDRGYITGVMAVEGNQNHAFADGNSPNWIWNGTPNSSSSTGPAL